MLDYVAIDFETANAYRGSPCAIGLVRVRGGVPVAEHRWLMRPPEEVDYFDAFNTMIHGITEEMVADSPRWRDALPWVLDFIGDDVVVAHNAGFDIGVIRYACAVDNIEWPELRFLCTMVLARRALSLPSYRLPFVADVFGGSCDNHHDPLADARAVVDIVSGLAAKYDAHDLDGLADAVGVRVGHMCSGIYKGSVSISGSAGGASRLVRAEVNPDADPDGYLYGRVVVFTGTLFSMTRQIAWDECCRIGAIPEHDTTKRTNVLVIGDINPAVLCPGATLTKKTQRAFELQERGQEIEVMTEDDFLRCLEGGLLTALPESVELSGKAPAEALPTRIRKVPLAERPTPQTPKPPKPLQREPVPSDQLCFVDGCPNTAAFRTRSKPTWCEFHIAEIQRYGRIRPLEPFTHPDDWQLTECLMCGATAHYRFVYTLDKNSIGEPTCRACFWRQWAAHQRASLGPWADLEPVPYEQAKAMAEANGFEYLGPLTAPSLRDDPHHVRCRRCGKISAERLGDISFGCTCQPRT
ncbi:MAG TPA: exonuclease domain-containing protein [Mycobacterium sp.]|nr:exonuclease domain-containing protein [Mycobacterium sp.]